MAPVSSRAQSVAPLPPIHTHSAFRAHPSARGVGIFPASGAASGARSVGIPSSSSRSRARSAGNPNVAIILEERHGEAQATDDVIVSVFQRLGMTLAGGSRLQVNLRVVKEMAHLNVGMVLPVAWFAQVRQTAVR